MNTRLTYYQIKHTGTLLLLAFLFVQHVIAEPENEDAAPKEYWSVQLENDFFANSGDRYYTNGIQVSRLVMGKPAEWLGKVASVFPAYQSDGGIEAVNYTVGQQIFTPDDTVSSELLLDDRPYAGYLFFSTSLLARVEHDSLYDTGNILDFTIGVVGPASLAEQSQTAFHKLFKVAVPQGWHNQLKNELGLGLSYSRFWRFIKPVSGPLEIGMNPQITATLGNVYTYGAVGVMVRLGTALDGDLSPPTIKPGYPGFALFRMDNHISWYFHFGVETRYVVRNIFLDGNSFEESHSVEKEPIVGDIQFGFVFKINNIRFAISNTMRSKEFTTQQQATHYGALNISWAL